jgi:ketosteroid isomerase-like protein
MNTTALCSLVESASPRWPIRAYGASWREDGGELMGSNATVIESAYAAFARGDIGGVLDLVGDDVEWSSPATLPQGGHFHGRDAVGQFFQAIGDGWSALTLDVEGVSEAGSDTVIGVVRADGKRRDGSPSGYGATHVFTVRHGKIVRFREYTDLDGPLG